MTATPAENQQAAAAQARGEAADGTHRTDAEAQHRTTSGSDVAIEAAATPDQVSVGWFGSGANAAQAVVRPSSPSPVNSDERSPGDPT